MLKNSAAILTEAVRLSQDMIGRLLSAGVDLFQLNFSHVTQPDHVVVAEHIRRQRAFAGTPNGGIGPSNIYNMYHGAACIVDLVARRRYGSHYERYCDTALVVATLPYFTRLILSNIDAVISNREARDSRTDSGPQLATPHKNCCYSWARKPESGHDWSLAGSGRRRISPQFQPRDTS